MSNSLPPICCLLINFASSLDPDQGHQPKVWHSDRIPEIIILQMAKNKHEKLPSMQLVHYSYGLGSGQHMCWSDCGGVQADLHLCCSLMKLHHDMAQLQ